MPAGGNNMKLKEYMKSKGKKKRKKSAWNVFNMVPLDEETRYDRPEPIFKNDQR